MLVSRFPVLRIVVAAAMGCLGLLGTAEPGVAQSYMSSHAMYESSMPPSVGSPSMLSAGGFQAEGAHASPSVELMSYGSMMGGASGCDDCLECTSWGPQYAGPRSCDRFYLSISGGWQQRERVREAADSSTFIEFDGGFSANGAIGYRFDKWRVEAEYTFMNNECSIAGSGGLSSETVGNINLRAFMFSAYRDFEIDGWVWKPYAGGGIGVFQSEINGLFPEFFQTVGGSFATSPINATSNMPFAYQFRVGASRPIGERTELFGGYRYFNGAEMQFSSAPFASGAAPTFNPNGAKTHGLEFGLRINF